MIITIEIDDSTLKINNFYGNSQFHTVDTVIMDILNRYSNIEYFDPDLLIDDCENDNLENFILNEIKQKSLILFSNNGYNKLLFDENLFSKAIIKKYFSISSIQFHVFILLPKFILNLLKKLIAMVI
ncbi:MAG: hypothetical protein R2771_05670 [Saprospiraceae bacterium]